MQEIKLQLDLNTDEILKLLSEIKQGIEDLKRQATNPILTDKLVYSAPDVAKMFSVNERTIYKAIEEGRMKCVRLGKAIRIPRQYIEDFMKGQ